jgi:ribosomal protein S18 acetylase RimI-like enzyme
LPKPVSIRAMQFILFFKIVIFIMGVGSLLFSPKDLNEITSNNLVSMILYSAFTLISMILMIILINRRKLIPSVLISFVVLFLSIIINQIQVILSLVLILLFFFRSTRAYFRGENNIKPATMKGQRQQTAEEASDTEAQTEPTEQVVTQAKAQSKKSKDPEVYIREAKPEDADTIHTLMLNAFEEYKAAVPPSSALEETEEGIAEALREERESAAILYEDDTAIAMVRFKYVDDVIYFFRLSVIPARRRRGYARQLVKWIEKQGVTKGLNISRCRVRQSIQNNLVLYQDMGYEIVDQELIVRPAGTVKTLTLDKKLRI